MKLHAKQEFIELDLSNVDRLKILPRFYLDAPRLIISHVYEKYENIHLREDLFGSKKFLDVNNETDIITFYRKNYDLAFLELGVPINVSPTDNSFKSAASIQNLMRITEEKSFELAKSAEAFYNKEEDILILTYEPHEAVSDSPIIEIAQDFYMLHRNGIVAGWLLKNCCQYICEPNGEFNERNNLQTRDALADFFLLYNESTFSQMEMQNKAIKAKLDKLIASARKNHIFVISEAIEEWIEDNY